MAGQDGVASGETQRVCFDRISGIVTIIFLYNMKPKHPVNPVDPV
jgi:hypothetical protein